MPLLRGFLGSVLFVSSLLHFQFLTRRLLSQFPLLAVALLIVSSEVSLPLGLGQSLRGGGGHLCYSKGAQSLLQAVTGAGVTLLASTTGHGRYTEVAQPLL